MELKKPSSRILDVVVTKERKLLGGSEVIALLWRLVGKKNPIGSLWLSGECD